MTDLTPPNTVLPEIPTAPKKRRVTTEKQRAAARANGLKAIAVNKGRPHTEKTKALLRMRMLGSKRPRSAVEKQRAKLKGYQWTLKQIEARRVANLGKVRDVSKTPLVARGPQNQNAITCELRSPDNVVYFVRNLTDWIRRHHHLFKPEDVIWTKRPSCSATCRASKGISKLRNARDPRGSWKGWTIVSDVEVYGNKGADLLARTFVQPPEYNRTSHTHYPTP
jgi:hypothetical protein